MKSRISLIALLSVFFFFIFNPANANDWGWYTDRYYHPHYYTMNVENEGFIYSSCWPVSEAKENWKLQVKLRGKKSKWTTVARGIPVFGRFDNANMQRYRWYIECDDPAEPVLIIYNWSPPDWQRDYQARLVYGNKNRVYSKFAIVIHTNLKKTKPYT